MSYDINSRSRAMYSLIFSDCRDLIPLYRIVVIQILGQNAWNGTRTSETCAACQAVRNSAWIDPSNGIVSILYDYMRKLCNYVLTLHVWVWSVYHYRILKSLKSAGL